MPFGATLQEIIYGVAGGMTSDTGKAVSDGFKAVQIGVPPAAALPATTWTFL